MAVVDLANGLQWSPFQIWWHAINFRLAGETEILAFGHQLMDTTPMAPYQMIKTGTLNSNPMLVTYPSYGFQTASGDWRINVVGIAFQTPPFNRRQKMLIRCWPV